MKKLLLLSVSLFIGTQSFAQDPDLYRTWYLYEIQLTDLNSLYVVSDIDPSIEPWITISETLEFNGEGACNTFMGTYVYDPQYYELVSSDLTRTNDDCNIQVHNLFENDYFGFMHRFWSNITSDSNGLTLRLENALFGYAIFKDYPLSINDNTFENTIMVYPNPVSDQLFISSEILQIENIRIYEISGKQVFQKVTNEASIDVSHLTEGVYFIEVRSPEGRSIQKFIKK